MAEVVVWAEGKFGTKFVKLYLSVQTMKEKCFYDINGSIKKQAGNIGCFLRGPMDICLEIVFLFLKK